jgi:hypothetical protein
MYLLRSGTMCIGITFLMKMAMHWVSDPVIRIRVAEPEPHVKILKSNKELQEYRYTIGMVQNYKNRSYKRSRKASLAIGIKLCSLKIVCTVKSRPEPPELEHGLVLFTPAVETHEVYAAPHN